MTAERRLALREAPQETVKVRVDHDHEDRKADERHRPDRPSQRDLVRLSLLLRPDPERQ